MRKPLAALSAALVVIGTLSSAAPAEDFHHATPVKHVIVIFNENISFDHYFASYPYAQNGSGETRFQASRGTPIANNLVTPLNPNRFFSPLEGVNLLTKNPNGPTGSGATFNGLSATNPFRLA
ncbi:MAG: alkaline phosphatase family protein, partial [Terracidiphilus sp.]